MGKLTMQKNPRKITEQNFNDVLLASIDEVLSALGENVKLNLYLHLEKGFNIKKQEIPQKLDLFTEALEAIFGVGSQPLEIMFMKKLHSKMREQLLSIELKDFTFPKYAEELKKNLIPANIEEAKTAQNCGNRTKNSAESNFLAFLETPPLLHVTAQTATVQTSET